MPRFPTALVSLFAATLFASLPAGCASGQSTDGSGGSASTGSGGGTSEGGSGSGGDGPCIYAADCAELADPCNVGTCINGVCVKTPANENAPCDDGKTCTSNDHCEAGVCTGPLQPCPATQACYVGYCDVETDSCTEIPGDDGTSCVDENACSITSYCSGGTCLPGQSVDCSFLNTTCAIGTCDPGLGCTVQVQNDGTSCDDGLYCTIDDTCSSGLCSGAPNTCAAPGDVCMIGSCDEANDKCFAVPGNDGNTCNDGNDCTAGETCASGKCLGGQPANNGAACDDADGCTSGTTCADGLCGAALSVNDQCVDGDQCCPAGCLADTDCLYWESGVLQNVQVSTLTGWTECFKDDYGDFNTSLGTVLSQCDKGKLLIGCRLAGSQTLTLAGMGERADVLFDCGQQPNCTKEANGVGFYYSDSYSWGFVPAGVAVQRNSCDVGFGSDDLRMCWHTGGGFMNGGYRCGNNYPFDGSWERVVFEAN